jgi:hypothetical protein
MDYAKWEAFCQQHSDIDASQIVRAAKDNMTILNGLSQKGKIGDAISDLFRIVPLGELQVWVNFLDAMRQEKVSDHINSVNHLWPASAICLPETWQPPEKPKELVGWNYIETIERAAVLLRTDTGDIIVLMPEFATISYLKPSPHRIAYGVYGEYAPAGICDVSESNSEILWQ